MFDIREMAKEKTLLVAHRGVCSGNIPCNTIPAFNAALAQGADVIELDVSRNVEGSLYIFHPGMEHQFLHSEKLIADMTDAEVAALRLCNGDGAYTQFPVPTVDEVFEALKGRCMINVDKFPMYPKEILAAIRRHKMEEQVILKTAPTEEWFRFMEDNAPDIAYLTLPWEKDEVSEILVKRKLHYIGTENLFTSDASEFATPEYHEKMHRMGLVTWVNAIVYDYKELLSGPFTDDISLCGEPEKGWGFLADVGFDLIQTDWVDLCRRYLDSRKR